jgi:hemoglobin
MRDDDETDIDARRRRAAVEAAARTGIDEAMIERQVRAFYAQAREDDVLGPVFARVVDWEPHLQRIIAFWSSVLLQTGRYHGRPMQAHFPLAIAAEHFDRWLALWAVVARETVPAAQADMFIARANMIGQSLEFGIASARGQVLRPGERLRG